MDIYIYIHRYICAYVYVQVHVYGVYVHVHVHVHYMYMTCIRTYNIYIYITNFIDKSQKDKDVYCANRQQTPCGVHQGCLTGSPRASILFNASPSVQIGEGDPALWAKAVRDHPGPQCQCFDMLQHVQFKEGIL